MNAYVQSVLDGLKQRYAHETEFLQAAQEMLHSLSPVFDQHPSLLKPTCWNALWRRSASSSSACPGGRQRPPAGEPRLPRTAFLGHWPYKGGMRFHPNVNLRF